MKKTEKLSEVKKAKFQELQKMIRDQKLLTNKLEELNKILSSLDKPMLLEDAAQKIGINEAGIKTIHRSTKNDIEIFSETKGQKEIWYIKIKKKQP